MSAATLTAPRTLTRRVSPVATVRHTMTLAWRTLVQIKHNPMELLDLSVQPIMFVLLFTYVFGGQMAPDGRPSTYLQYALPGIIAQNALFATLNTGVGLNTDITKGVFDRLRALPIARMSPLAGRILADTVKQAWSMGVLLAIGILIGFRVKTDVTGVVGARLALEAVKEIVGAGDSLAGKLWLFDGLTGDGRTIALPADPACAVCGG